MARAEIPGDGGRDNIPTATVPPSEYFPVAVYVGHTHSTLSEKRCVCVWLLNVNGCT